MRYLCISLFLFISLFLLLFGRPSFEQTDQTNNITKQKKQKKYLPLSLSLSLSLSISLSLSLSLSLSFYFHIISFPTNQSPKQTNKNLNEIFTTLYIITFYLNLILSLSLVPRQITPNEANRGEEKRGNVTLSLSPTVQRSIEVQRERE